MSPTWCGKASRRDTFATAWRVRLTSRTLRKLWLSISPPSYYDLYSAHKKRSKFIYTRYDTTFPVRLSRDVIEGARRRRWDHEVSVLACGHYTMGEFPFKYLTGYEICSFLKRNL